MKQTFVFLILSVFVIASAPRTGLADDSDSIKIGSVLILTGEGASWGNAARNGIDMAVEKINAAGGLLGKRLIAVHQDDHGDPKTSISAFRQLTSEGARFIIGPTWSNLGLPLIDMADKSKTIVISPSLGVAKFNESSRFLFNTWPHDSLLSEKLADYVFSKNHRTVAIVGAEHVWVKEQTTAFKERFEKLGGKVGFLTEPLPGTTDLRTDALKLVNVPGIDAVISTTDGVLVGSLMAKALLDHRSKLPFFSISLDEAAIDAAQGGFEGLEFLTFLTPTSEFKQEYESRFHTGIDIGADSAYDAVMLLAQAIRESGSVDTEAVSAKLSEIKKYNGVSGLLVSDGKRGFTKAHAIKKVIEGKPRDIAAVL